MLGIENFLAGGDSLIDSRYINLMLRKYNVPREPNAWRIISGAVYGVPGEGPIPIDPNDDARRSELLNATTLFLSSQWSRKYDLVYKGVDVLQTECPAVVRVIDGLYPDKEEAAEYLASIRKFLARMAFE